MSHNNCACNDQVSRTPRYAGILGGHPWLYSDDLRMILAGEDSLDETELYQSSPLMADGIVLAIGLLSGLAGLVIPLVFGVLTTLHGKAYTGLTLLALTFTGVLPLGSCYITLLVGFRSLSLYRRLIEDEIVNKRQYDYIVTFLKVSHFKMNVS